MQSENSSEDGWGSEARGGGWVEVHVADDEGRMMDRIGEQVGNKMIESQSTIMEQ